jgi:transposase-like protein
MMRKVVQSRRWSMTLTLKKKGKIVGLQRSKGRGQMEKTDKSKVEDKRGRKVSVHTAEDKCRAVLSVWTEKRRAGEVCRELGIAWALLNQWQARAMEGMLLALQPRVQVEKAVALSPRLAVLLDKKIQQGAGRGMERRLARLQSKTRPYERSPGKPGESQEGGV